MAAISFEKDGADDDISAACVKEQTFTKDRVALSRAQEVCRGHLEEDKLCVIDSTTHSLGDDHQLLRRGASRSSNLPSTGNSSLAKNAGL